MKKISKIVLWIWSALMLLSGGITWLSTMGVVQSTEFSLQISILNKIGMLLVWVALFTVWRTLDESPTKG